MNNQELTQKAAQAMTKTFRMRSEALGKQLDAGVKDDAEQLKSRKDALDALLAAPARTLGEFKIGDTVDVSVRIVEGEKERIQVFSGVVTSRRGSGASEMFTVRRIVNNEGVERTFPLMSPKLAGISVVRGGRVRRAKLYFLRKRVGKATRLRDLKTAVESKPQAAEPAAATQEA